MKYWVLCPLDPVDIFRYITRPSQKEITDISSCDNYVPVTCPTLGFFLFYSLENQQKKQKSLSKFKQHTEPQLLRK